MAAISDTWVQRLLHETEPVTAVRTLAQFWSHRLDPRDERFGLTLPEYHIQLVLIYVGEVGNGGNDQFVENRGADRVPDTIDALSAVGLGALATLLRDVGSEADRPALDREVWRRSSDVNEALLAYARENEAAILTPERRVA